jgi:hypothetical protein
MIGVTQQPRMSANKRTSSNKLLPQPPYLLQEMTACKPLSQGSCIFGASCRNEHVDSTPTTPWKSTSALVSNSDRPSSTLPFTAATRDIATKSESLAFVPCIFFRRGACAYGAWCCNSHEPPAASPLASTQDNTSVSSANEKLNPTSPVFVPASQQTSQSQISTRDWVCHLNLPLADIFPVIQVHVSSEKPAAFCMIQRPEICHEEWILMLQI